MGVAMAMLVRMAMPLVVVVVVMAMLVIVMMMMKVMLISRAFLMLGEVNIEFDSRNGALFTAGSGKFKSFHSQFIQLALEHFKGNAQVDHRAQEHVAADPAKNIQIQRFHSVLRIG
jgi:hypothetical protein